MGGEKFVHKKSNLFFYSLLTFFIVFLVVLPSKSTFADVVNIKPIMNMYFFYNNPCATCNEEGKFYERFNNIVGTEKNDVNPQFFVYNYIKQGTEAKFNEICDQYKYL